MKRFLKSLLSRRTRTALSFDKLRFLARFRNQRKRNLQPPSTRLHFGCGRRYVKGWLNVDVVGSEFDIDLSSRLPWANEVFECVVSQQVIEHLEIESELEPLLDELARVSKPNAELWLACPDLEKVCRAYVETGGSSLFVDRRTRHDFPWREGMPYSQMVNILFHQGNEHRNLFDFALLSWILYQHGFDRVERTSEPEFLARFPEFELRNDDWHALYIRARRAQK